MSERELRGSLRDMGGGICQAKWAVKAPAGLKLEDGPDGFKVLRDVVLVTDTPVREFIATDGFWGMGLLELPLPKNTVQKWRDANVLTSAGGLPFLRDHGRGRTPSIDDLAGQLLNLRVADREDKAGKRRGLVVDPHFDPDVWRFWFGESWVDIVNRGTIGLEWSIGFQFDRKRLKLVDEATRHYQAVGWWGIEGSVVYSGADQNSGAHRAQGQPEMTPEQMAKMIEDAAKAGATQVLQAQSAQRAPDVASPPEPARPNPYDSELCDTLRATLAPKLSGTELDKLNKAARESETPEQVYADKLRQLNTAPVEPPPSAETDVELTTRVSGGDEGRYQQLNEIVTLFTGRYDADPVRQPNTAKLHSRSLEAAERLGYPDNQASLSQMLFDWTRQHSPTAGHRTPEGSAGHLSFLAAHWPHAANAHDGHPDPTVRRFHAGRWVGTSKRAQPADLPAVLQTIVRQVFLAGYEDEVIDYPMWSQVYQVDDFDELTLIRSDMLVKFDVVGEMQQFHRAFAFDEEYTLEAQPYGAAYEVGFHAMWRRGGERLVAMARNIGRRFGAGPGHKMLDLLTTSADAIPVERQSTNASFDAWITTEVVHIAAEQDPVRKPSSGVPKDMPKFYTSALMPNQLILGAKTAKNTRDEMVPVTPQGVRTDGKSDPSVVDTESIAIYDMRRQYMQLHNDPRQYLFVGRGDYATFNHVQVRGYPPSLMIDMNGPIDRLQRMKTSVQMGWGAVLANEQTLYTRTPA